jgi:elongation of very long chain fatty acids protein 6
MLDFARENYWLPVVACVLYLAWCYFSTIYMKDRERFDLRYPLAYWNLFLAVFSAYGMIRTVPHMIYDLQHATFEETVCLHPSAHPQHWGTGATGLAVQLFIFSKFPELIDTVFITLRKRPLLFLHWYHHFTVLLFCWISYATESGAGLYFVSMNYSVHAIMYFYYYLMAIKVVPKWFPAWIITFLQISQMVVGMIVVGAGVHFKINGGEKFAPGECANDTYNMIAGVVMYGSYFILFVEFAFGRYIFGKKSSKKEE